MRCKHCRHKYSANPYSAGPAGFDSPGIYFFLGVFLAAASTLFFYLDLPILKWSSLIAALFVVVVPLPTAWRYSHVSDDAPHFGGDVCPECLGRNRVWPWSL